MTADAYETILAELAEFFGDESLLDRESLDGGSNEKPGRNQIAALRRAGVTVHESMTRRVAAKIVAHVKDRERRGLCELNQARVLKMFGFEGAEKFAPDEATEKIIDFIGASKRNRMKWNRIKIEMSEHEGWKAWKHRTKLIENLSGQPRNLF